MGFEIIYAVLTALLKFDYYNFFAVVVSLPRALAIALGKYFFLKILNISLPRARDEALGIGLF